MIGNAVLGRELRERMRGPRAAVVLTVYLGLLVGLFWLVYRAQAGGSVGGSQLIAPTEVARVGRGIYEWVLFFVLLLVVFLVPGLSAGAIAGERERQTLVPLQLTDLRAGSIVVGKVAASLAFLVLLVVATLPLLAICYLIGGISLTQLLAGVVAVVASGVLFSCIAVACSSLVRRVQTATVLSYGIALLLTAGTLLGYSAAGLLDQGRATPIGADRADEASSPPAVILIANPFAVATAATAADGPLDESQRTSSPFQPLRELIDPVRTDGNGGTGGGTRPGATTSTTFVPGGGGVVIIDDIGPAIGPSSGTVPPATTPSGAGSGGGGVVAEGFAPFLRDSFGVMLALSVLAVVVASVRIRIPARTER